MKMVTIARLTAIPEWKFLGVAAARRMLADAMRASPIPKKILGHFEKQDSCCIL